MKTSLILVFFLAVWFSAGVVPSGNSAEKVLSKKTQELDERKRSIRAGRGKAQLCTRCHGRLGMLQAVEIAQFKGTVEGFVIKELIDFRQGVRAHAVMNSIAQTLSDKDINDIAAWYNAISIRP